MAYWNTSVQTFFLPHDTRLTIAAFCSANFVCDENNSTFSSVILPTFLHAFLADFCSFEIRLHLFECIIERVIACE